MSSGNTWADGNGARDELRFNEYVLDTARGALIKGGHEIPLRRKTWQLLCYLAARPGHLLGKDELHAELWPDSVASDDSLVQCVVELRRALCDHEKRIIRTVAGRGYRFAAPAFAAPAQRGTPTAASNQARMVGANPDLALADAWNLLRGLAHRGAVVDARRRFERELQADEKSAAALTGIALSHVVDVLNRWSALPGWQLELARDAADRALGLEPGAALAHHARAHVAMLEGCHFEARAGFRKALALDPTLGHAHLRIGIIELETGHSERTAEHVRQALCSPHRNPDFEAQAWFIQGMAAFHLGRDDDALGCLQRSIALKPYDGFAHQWHAVIDALHGREGAAVAHLAHFRRRAPGHSIESLRATERSWNPVFLTQRNRFYVGLRRAGMPE